MAPSGFVDYLDDDAVSGVPVRISVTATLDSGRLHLDFTGTDPQLAAAFNIASHGRAHAWITTRVLALVSTIDPTIALNAGLVRPISVTAPAGSVVNATRPAAVGIRHATASRVNDALSGALGLAAPRILPAASSGLVVPLVVAEPDNVQVLEPMVGGTGARFGADGVDGRASGISNLSNNPVETVETEIGVEILRYGLVPDSGGAGRWRGGCGLELTFLVLVDGARLLARGLERMCFRPWGVRGGQPGTPARLSINGEPVGKVDMVPLRRGDTVTLRTSGAGGYGEPFRRDPAEVGRDVRRGVVSVPAAARQYGVVCAVDGTVDLPATAALREATERDAEPGEGFGFGPERTAWESVFDVDTADELVAFLFALPAPERYRRRAEIYAAALAALPADFPRTPADATARTAARTALRRALD